MGEDYCDECAMMNEAQRGAGRGVGLYFREVDHLERLREASFDISVE